MHESFGRGMLREWALDPTITYLNHGTVGSPPRRVLDAQQRIRDAIERQPAAFLLRELSDTAVGVPRVEAPRMRQAADAVASFLGARGADLVFVENATAGINAVLRSAPIAAGDEIVIGDHAYGAIRNATTFTARTRGAVLRVVELPEPREAPSAFIEAYARAVGPRTRLCIVDHITSESALLLPVNEIVRACRGRGAAVLVDGAHAPGALDLDIESIGADWYVGNLHKWAYAPRSCGILWAAPERQRELHPPVISWGLDRGFASEFDWAGTRDPSPYLAAPEGIAFLRELGPERVRAYSHDLAWSGASLLCERWETELEVPESMIGTMATVPLPAHFGSEREDAARLRDALLFEDRIEVQIHPWKGRLWARISTQIYNERSDVERLADAVRARMGLRPERAAPSDGSSGPAARRSEARSR